MATLYIFINICDNIYCTKYKISRIFCCYFLFLSLFIAIIYSIFNFFSNLPKPSYFWVVLFACVRLWIYNRTVTVIWHRVISPILRIIGNNNQTAQTAFKESIYKFENASFYAPLNTSNWTMNGVEFIDEREFACEHQTTVCSHAWRRTLDKAGSCKWKVVWCFICLIFNSLNLCRWWWRSISHPVWRHSDFDFLLSFDVLLLSLFLSCICTCVLQLHYLIFDYVFFSYSLPVWHATSGSTRQRLVVVCCLFYINNNYSLILDSNSHIFAW